jgi:hypothetical protein
VLHHAHQPVLIVRGAEHESEADAEKTTETASS